MWFKEKCNACKIEKKYIYIYIYLKLMNYFYSIAQTYFTCFNFCI